MSGTVNTGSGFGFGAGLDTGFSNRRNFSSRVDGGGSERLRAFVTNNIIQTNQESIVSRISRYHLNWNFYEGNHWKDYNDSMISMNYVAAFINKILKFMLGKDSVHLTVKDLFTDSLLDDNNKMAINAERTLMRNWNKNGKWLSVRSILQTGSVFGDCWVGMSYEKEGNYVKYTTYDSRYCIPKFETGTLDSLKSLEIRQPMVRNEKDYVLKIIEYSKDNVRTWFQKSLSDEDGVDKLELKTDKNPFGFIPLVHFTNMPRSTSYYGRSDVEDILKLNKTYNEISQRIKTIIDYYADPITVVTGANAKQLKRGLGQIWSGLPEGAQVFNLTLGSDLGSVYMFRDSIKTSMHELADIPENVLGQLQAISNTSGEAMELTYLPLIQICHDKKEAYNVGFTELHEKTLKMLSAYNYSDKYFDALPDDFLDNHQVEITYTYGLPKDRAEELDLAIKEINNQLGSRQEWMEKLGKNSVDKLMKQIEKEEERFSSSYRKDEKSNKEDGASENKKAAVDDDNRSKK